MFYLYDKLVNIAEPPTFTVVLHYHLFMGIRNIITPDNI